MNNDELYHYGIKGMRWKDHKYRGFLNGKYVYDIAQQAQGRLNTTKRLARSQAARLRANAARYADSLKGRPSVSDNKLRARLRNPGVLRNRMYDARSSSNEARLSRLASMTKKRAQTAKKHIGEKYRYLDERAREHSKRYSELAGMTKRRVVNANNRRRAAAREIDRRRAEWENGATSRLSDTKSRAREQVARANGKRFKAKLAISKLKGNARKLYKTARSEVSKRAPAYREAAKDRYNKIKYTVRGKSRAAAFRASSKYNKAKRYVEKNLPVAKARVRKQLGDAKFRVQDQLAKAKWDSHYAQAKLKVDAAEARKKAGKAVDSRVNSAKKSWNKRMSKAARKAYWKWQANDFKQFGAEAGALWNEGYNPKKYRKYSRKARQYKRRRLANARKNMLYKGLKL